MLHSSLRTSIGLFTSLNILYHHAFAETPDTLTKAVSENRAPICNPVYGDPKVVDCSDALEHFAAIINRRGFPLDQEVEFLGWGVNPLHADSLARQSLSPREYTFSKPRPDGSHCVLQYGMEDTPDLYTIDPELTYPSAVSTHEDFIASTRLLISFCVSALKIGGHMRIRGVSGQPIAVIVSSSAKQKPDLINDLTNTNNYQVPAENKELFRGVVNPVGGSWPEFGDPGQGSSTGAGQGRDISWWHRYCTSGTTYASGQCAINQECEPEVTSQNKEVLWGTAIDIMLKFVGSCTKEQSGTRSSASYWNQRSRSL